MSVEWLEKPVNDLQSIYDYIYTKSPHNAEMVVQTLTQLGDSLADMPFKYPKEPIFNQENIRFVVKWSYKIIYRIEKDTILVSRIFHTKQHPDKIIAAE